MKQEDRKRILTYAHGENYRFKGLAVDKKGNYIFDSNLAYKCVQEMEQRKQYADFYDYFYDYWMLHIREDQDAEYWEWGLWSSNPKNFFDCFGSWLAEREVKK
jgi:hypothetical protein